MKRSRKFQIFILSVYGIGLLVHFLSQIFRNSLSDFDMGFSEGFAVTCMVAGFVYFAWCLIHRINPYQSDKDTGKR